MKTMKWVNLPGLFLFFALSIGLISCVPELPDNTLELNRESCVLDNENSYAEITVANMTGTSLSISSSNPDVAEICLDKEEKGTFYIIGRNQGKATITVIDVDDAKTGEYNMNTIEVDVRTSIDYPDFSTETIFLKAGESRVFSQFLDFDDNYSYVVDNETIAKVSTSQAMNKKFKVEAKHKGYTSFHIYKGKVKLATIGIHVVDEYDLYIPSSEQLTFKLPFTYGVNGFTIWRGSGQYSAKAVDETIAKVTTITPGEDWFNTMNNCAAVRAQPLKAGKTSVIVTDMVTGQTAGVNLEVN